MWGRCLTARSMTGHLPGKQAAGSSSALAQSANPATYGPRGTRYALPCARGGSISSLAN